MNPTTMQMVGAALFGVAILHTFSTKFFEHLAHTRPAHARLWHLLGEVEVVFGFWALILFLAMFFVEGISSATRYIDSRSYTEPLFIFVIMVIAGTRPILRTVTSVVTRVAHAVPLPGSIGFFFIVLTIVPLLGSFIAEPAAMTLAALILAEHICGRKISERLKYATIGVLFVNISIGGVLTPFAAPPVLMVAEKWGWDISFMLSHFGWKAAIAVLVNGLGATLLFYKELAGLRLKDKPTGEPIPYFLVVVHIGFLVAVVFAAHHPPIFIGLFIFFLGIAYAYQRYQDRLIMREGLLVTFFLAGLVILGGQQEWWLQPLLTSMSSNVVFFGATALTAVTDNAALTYLGSLVEGLSDSFKYALVAGAVTGGGLTIIANAPNPAGVAILRGCFDEESIRPLGLLFAALPPTLIAGLALKYL